ncbi:hypothetical protein LPIBR_170004 [Lacticaseibacillus paracasei]|nr:hypothetical protein LPIBR_170004 [Lacticaseibacillus paracasei]
MWGQRSQGCGASEILSKSIWVLQKKDVFAFKGKNVLFYVRFN